MFIHINYKRRSDYDKAPLIQNWDSQQQSGWFKRGTPISILFSYRDDRRIDFQFRIIMLVLGYGLVTGLTAFRISISPQSIQRIFMDRYRQEQR